MGEEGRIGVEVAIVIGSVIATEVEEEQGRFQTMLSYLAITAAGNRIAIRTSSLVETETQITAAVATEIHVGAVEGSEGAETTAEREETETHTAETEVDKGDGLKAAKGSRNSHPPHSPPNTLPRGQRTSCAIQRFKRLTKLPASRIRDTTYFLMGAG